MEKFISKSKFVIVLLVVLLVPVLALPISPNVFIPAKLIILVSGLIVLTALTMISLIVSGKSKTNLSTFDVPILLIIAAYIASVYFVSPNKMEAILLPGTATAVVGSGIFYFFVIQLKKSQKSLASLALLISGALVSLISILTYFGTFSFAKGQFAYLSVKSFTPVGGYLPLVIISVGLLPMAIGKIFASEKVVLKIVSAVSAVILIAGTLLGVYVSLPGKEFELRLPTHRLSWEIAVDSIKDSPLLGAGPGNYLTAFNRFKPVEYNSTNIWQLKFTNSRSFYLTLLTEVGLLGFVGALLIFYLLAKMLRKEMKKKNYLEPSNFQLANLASLAVTSVLFLFFPANIVTVFLFFVLLALNANSKETTANLKASGDIDGLGSRWLAVMISVPVLVLLVALSIRMAKIVDAEYTFQRAIVDISNGKVISAYDKSRNAINKNPSVDRYHSIYAQINIALANSIAKSASDKGEELTDEQRQQITTLIQQAIREARFTVAANQFRADNWMVLGNIYRSLIPLANDADKYAIQSYTQAVALDPINPLNRLAIANVYFGAEDYETAVKILEGAVSIKPDYPNSRYNLAFAYKANGQIDKAIDQMTIVVSLLPEGSNDRDLAVKSLEEFQSAKAGEAKTGEELTAPENPEDVLDPKVDLTDQDQPPGEVVTPTPVEIQEDSTEITTTPIPSPAP